MTRTTNGITIATIGMSATTTTRTPMQEEAILPRNKTRRSSLIFFLVLLSVVILICDNTITSSTLHLLITKGAPETLTNSTFQREQVHASINTFHNISHDRNDQPPQFWNISIVVQLSGELGNHLSKLAFGYAIQRRLWDHYAIPSHLVLQHQSSRKWIQARQDVQKCFPQFRSMDFTQGNTLEFQERLSEQQKWLGNENSSKLVLSNLIHSHEVEEKLIFLKSLLEQSSPITKNHGSTNNISLPFLYAQSFASWEYIDTYYHGLKRLFAFDDDACCRELPKPEEYVFHFRNFVTEMPRRGKQKGYEEIPPNQSVELFSSTPTKKVAIATRIYNEKAQAYFEVLSKEGWTPRVVHNQTGTQDFCFLQHANHLIGGIRSTFAMWAGLLGNASRFTLYSINCTETLAALGEKEVFLDYTFITPELNNRIRFVTVTPRKEFYGIQ